MYICLCHPFSDKKVSKFLKEKTGEKTKVSEVYGSCSGGEKPDCCSCMQTLKEIVKDHNKKQDTILA